MSTVEPTEYDPFEEFNRSAGIGVVEDPYPMFKLARATAPLIREDVRAMAGLEVEGEDQAAFIDPDLLGEIPDVYTAFTFDAVQAVLRDGEVFSSKGYEDVMGQVMGHTILEMDEPEHHTYRGIVQQAFSRKTMERWEVEAITPIVDEHIDAFIDRGHAELVRELTFPFPVRVIARLLGLPNSEMEHFHRLAVELISVGFDMDRGLAASQALGDYLGAILADRRESPADDLMSTLAQAELDGQHLTDDEIFAFLRLLLPAGAETTYRSSGNLLFGLLNDPAQLDAVRHDRSLIPQAIEEGLRWEPPLLTIIRTATRDTEVEGMPIPAGSMVVINMGSANHDEKYWTDPERFDIFRTQRQHLAFAFGPHMCLGMHLARMETRIVLDRLLDRLPDLRLDPSEPAPFITGMTFRNPDRLPVVWG
ncbi:MAG TPA: cytochrome P450 [Acidimicrobiia bacterium]